MRAFEARAVIEHLRKGIPPEGHIQEFTVGRQPEIEELAARLYRKEAGVLLVKANWGVGKTHLLKLVREMALREGFAVSLVTLDARAGVRLNRMDQIVGAVFRNLQMPGAIGSIGVRPFMDFVIAKIEAGKGSASGFWYELTNGWTWDYSESLESKSSFIALRAWAAGNDEVRNTVEDWLLHPWVYQTQRKVLYRDLVEQFRGRFRDPRPEWQFYADQVFVFNTMGYLQCWAVLRDMQTLLTEASLGGLVILFDECEDVVTNLSNRAHQQAAFWNLFQLCSGRQYTGMSFFAVTPDFIQTCKIVLLSKGVWDFDYGRFDLLPSFEMTPLDAKDLHELTGRVISAYSIAYGIEVGHLPERQIGEMVREASGMPLQDRTRHCVRQAVAMLDSFAQEQTWISTD